MSDQILVLGAGQSAPYLIKYLLDRAESLDWQVVVADRDEALAQSRVGDHPRGQAVFVDAMDTEMVRGMVKASKVVVNFLAPPFQYPVSKICVQEGRHMVSASYQDERVKAQHEDAKAAGVTILTEMGLDPGLDHMSAMRLIHEIQDAGGIITHLASYGSGVPSTDSRSNPFDYAITWNPRNVVMAAATGAQYLEGGQIKVVPHPEVFHRTWPYEVPGLGRMEAYPNRDSISYKSVYGLPNCETLIRGTLRFPGFSETWYHIARLGLPNEVLHIPNLAETTWAELTEMFLPPGGTGDLELRVARHLGISATGVIMDKMRWLGLFSDEATEAPGDTAAQAMSHLLQDKLQLPKGGRDMVILAHELLVTYPKENRKDRVTSTLVQHGERDGMTAMSLTVGLPAAIGARLLMEDKFPCTGSHIPTTPDIYEPMLKELGEAGLTFDEVTTAL